MRTGLESSSASVPMRARPARMQTAPISTARAPARAIALSGSPSAPTSGRIDRRDQRRQRRVGSEHEDARRPEDRVGEQRHDRRVEAGHRRQTGQLRVGHALRDQQRGDREPGDDVAAQVGAPIVQRQVEPRQPAPPALVRGATRGDGDRLRRRAVAGGLDRRGWRAHRGGILPQREDVVGHVDAHHPAAHVATLVGPPRSSTL